MGTHFPITHIHPHTLRREPHIQHGVVEPVDLVAGALEGALDEAQHFCWLRWNFSYRLGHVAKRILVNDLLGRAVVALLSDAAGTSLEAPGHAKPQRWKLDGLATDH